MQYRTEKRRTLVVVMVSVLWAAGDAAPARGQGSEAGELARLRVEVAKLQQELSEQRQMIIQMTQIEQQRYDLLLKLIQSGGTGAGATSIAPLPPLPVPGRTRSEPPSADRKDSTIVANQGTINGTVTGSADFRDVYVYVDGIKSQPKNQSLEIAQRGKSFVPAVSVVQVGARVTFPNYDTVIHNVFSSASGSAFDLGTVKGGDRSSPVVLLKPGHIEVFCNIHAKMRADLLVVPNAHWTRVAPDGSFQIPGVPTGSRKVVLWGPGLLPASQKVEVTAKGGAVTFSVSPATARPHLNKQGQPYGSYGE